MQTSQALSMLNSGAGTPRLLVTLDTLIERYDNDLGCWGLQCSGIQEQLRECNEDRSSKRQKSKKREEEETKTIMDLNLLPKRISIEQMRKDLSEEENKLDRELKKEA